MAETLQFRPMTLAEFVPLVGRVFEVDCQPRVARLTLVEAKPGRWMQDAARPPFDLLFRSAPEVVLLEATYKMACGSFGPDWIGIMPIAPPIDAAAGRYYEAVFN